MPLFGLKEELVTGGGAILHLLGVSFDWESESHFRDNQSCLCLSNPSEQR